MEKIAKKTKLQKEHENLVNYAQARRVESKLPKYTQGSIEESIALKHNCLKVKNKWVQLHQGTTKKYTFFAPHKEVLKDLEMTKEDFFKKYPKYRILIQQNEGKNM